MRPLALKLFNTEEARGALISDLGRTTATSSILSPDDQLRAGWLVARDSVPWPTFRGSVVMEASGLGLAQAAPPLRFAVGRKGWLQNPPPQLHACLARAVGMHAPPHGTEPSSRRVSISSALLSPQVILEESAVDSVQEYCHPVRVE